MAPGRQKRRLFRSASSGCRPCNRTALTALPSLARRMDQTQDGPCDPASRAGDALDTHSSWLYPRRGPRSTPASGTRKHPGWRRRFPVRDRFASLWRFRLTPPPTLENVAGEGGGWKRVMWSARSLHEALSERRRYVGHGVCGPPRCNALSVAIMVARGSVRRPAGGYAFIVKTSRGTSYKETQTVSKSTFQFADRLRSEYHGGRDPIAIRAPCATGLYRSRHRD